MPEGLIKKLPLENGLTVNLMDASKKIAGDRWFVSLIARIEIPVNNEFMGLGGNQADKQKMNMEDIIGCLGDVVIFEKKMERNFISADEKESILKNFISSVARLSKNYYGHPDFARKFILKQFKEERQRQTWYS